MIKQIIKEIESVENGGAKFIILFEVCISIVIIVKLIKLVVVT